MNKFVLSTDTSCDVFKDELAKNAIQYIPLTYTIGGETFEDHLTADAEYKAFYDKIRAGAMPVTSQINSFLHEEFFEKILNEGASEIVHLSLSGGLSATAESAQQAAEAVMEKHTGCKIFIVDTLAATMGHRLLLDDAMKMRNEGKTAKEVFDVLKDEVSHLQHWVVVNDLKHLKRGGRVSGASAFIGSLLQIKPILILNNVGKLIVTSKVMGFTKGLKHIVEKMGEYGVDINNQTLYIACADNFDVADTLEALIKEKYTCKIQKGWIGPVIGSHTGTGTISIMFKGKERLTTK